MAQSLAEWRPEAVKLQTEVEAAVYFAALNAWPPVQARTIMTETTPRQMRIASLAARLAVRALECPRVTDGLRETWEEFRQACTYEAHNECFYGPWEKCCEQGCPRLHPPTGCGSETVSTKPMRARRGM